MANKKSKKKATKAHEAPVAAQKADKSKAIKAKEKAKAKAKKNAKPGMISRAKKYLGSVRSEMKRVTWPSKQELINYSLAVCASLIVVGIVIAGLDMIISEGLVLFSGLRG